MLRSDPPQPGLWREGRRFVVDSMLAWIVLFLVSVAPPVARVELEGQASYTARVKAIVETAAMVVYDPAEPRVHKGPWGLERSLMLTLAVGYHESMGFRREVDNGTIKGDHGATVCLMGIMVGRGRAEGWTATQLIQDREKCLRVGYHRIRQSLSICGSGPNGLAVYASGRCEYGRKVSREMSTLADRWVGKLKVAWEKGEWGAEQHN